MVVDILTNYKHWIQCVELYIQILLSRFRYISYDSLENLMTITYQIGLLYCCHCFAYMLIYSLRSWRDFVRECFCFGSEAVNASGEAVRGFGQGSLTNPASYTGYITPQAFGRNSPSSCEGSVLSASSSSKISWTWQSEKTFLIIKRKKSIDLTEC